MGTQVQRLAVVGVGDVAGRDYLPELHRLAGRAELVAVCDRTGVRARAVAEQYGCRAYASYAEMLAESEADAVLNLTPMQVHEETTLAALRAGKHVFSEKPLAGTVAGSRAAARGGARARPRLVSAPCVMVFPQVLTARRLLDEGAIGAVYAARGVGHGGVPPWSGYTSDPWHFFARGGGPLRDMGVYPLHALTGLLGPVRRVMAMAGQAQQSFVVADGPAQGKEVPMEVEDNWHLLLDLGGGRLASLQADNCVQGSLAPPLELYGLGGTIALDLLNMTAPVRLLRPGQGWTEIAPPADARAGGPDHLLGVAHLLDCIETRTEPVLSASPRPACRGDPGEGHAVRRRWAGSWM